MSSWIESCQVMNAQGGSLDGIPILFNVGGSLPRGLQWLFGV